MSQRHANTEAELGCAGACTCTAAAPAEEATVGLTKTFTGALRIVRQNGHEDSAQFMEEIRAVRRSSEQLWALVQELLPDLQLSDSNGETST